MNRCRYCQRPFVNKDRLAKHIHDAHKFMCSGCDKWQIRTTRKRMIGEFAFCTPCYTKEKEGQP